MPKLDVPFIRQIADGACGAAALEMVYLHYDLRGFDQRAFFELRKALEPHGSGEFRITTEMLVDDARSRGLKAVWFRVDWQDEAKMLDIIDRHIEKKIPLIACQRYTNQRYLEGHFRVITGRDRKRIFAHDPCPTIGCRDFARRFAEFADFWKPNGANVTGGVAVQILPPGFTA